MQSRSCDNMPIIYIHNFTLLHFSRLFYVIYESWIRRGIQRIRYFAFYYYMQSFRLNSWLYQNVSVLHSNFRKFSSKYNWSKHLVRLKVYATSCFTILPFRTHLLVLHILQEYHCIICHYQSFSLFLSYMFVVSLHVFFVTLFSVLILNILQFDSHLYTYIIIHVPCGRTHVSRITDITNNIHFSSLNIL